MSMPATPIPSPSAGPRLPTTSSHRSLGSAAAPSTSKPNVHRNFRIGTLALWSLGSFASLASFTFVQTPTFEAGGPNSQYGGGPITVSGNVVSGREGNGVVQFAGTFSSISWTDTFENFYGFTVGAAGTGIPEPVSMSLLGVGVAGLGFLRRRGGPASSTLL